MGAFLSIVVVSSNMKLLEQVQRSQKAIPLGKFISLSGYWPSGIGKLEGHFFLVPLFT